MAQRYDTYKDSGVQWLGEIPGHWKMTQLRKYLKSFSEKGFPQEQLLSVTREQGVIVRNVESKEENHNAISEDLSKYKLVENGQFVINKMKAWQGSYAVSNYRGIVSPAYFVYNLDNINGKFFSRAIRSKIYVSFFAQYSKGIRVGQWDLSPISAMSIPFIEPPLPEQHSIVTYLDDKCAKIVEWIEKKEKEVELLGEMKQRVIADAVTRGLNPNVKMKPATNSFFGMIPNHWEEIKMKYLFNERSEKNHPEEISLCATQTYGVIPQKLYCSYGHRVVEVSKGFELLKFVKEGDFVIHLRSFQGGIEYAYYQGIISPAYTILEPKDKSNTMYFKYLFKSYNYIQLLKTCVTGIREGQNINYSLLGKKHIPIPPISEQQEIVSYINDKTSKIDTLVAKVTKEIEHLKEYKQRLISDVVTGQIKVC